MRAPNENIEVICDEQNIHLSAYGYNIDLSIIIYRVGEMHYESRKWAFKTLENVPVKEVKAPHQWSKIAQEFDKIYKKKLMETKELPNEGQI